MSDVSEVLRRPDNIWYRENMKKTPGGENETADGVAGSSADAGLNPALNIGADAPITVLKPPFYTDTGGHFNQETGAGYAQADAQEEIDDEEGL